MNNTLKAAALGLCVLVAACGGGGGGGAPTVGPGPNPVPITISPTVATVPVGGQARFTLSTAASTTWSVDSDEGGNGAVGTISPVGVYTAPFVLPSLSTAILPSPSTAIGPTSVTVTASGATNSATVQVVSRFFLEDPVAVGACPPAAVNCIRAMASADLDGDHRSDLVVADSAAGKFSVILRQASGGFAPPRHFDVGNPLSSNPQAIVTSDMDHNGNVDVIVADAGTGQEAVRYRMGIGAGDFGGEALVSLAGNSGPISIGIGRFNGDARPDAAVANYGSDTVSILLGTGSGLGPAYTLLPHELSAPIGVAVADFDGDSLDDLAVANAGDASGAAVVVFFSNGVGGFPLFESYPLSGQPSAILAVDIDRDGDMDLAVTTGIAKDLQIFKNNRASNSSGPTFIDAVVIGPTGPEPVALVSADFNRDQRADIAVVNSGDNTITIYLGVAGVERMVPSETYRPGENPRAIAVGDFDNDSWPDLAVANSGDDTVTILRNRGQ